MLSATISSVSEKNRSIEAEQVYQAGQNLPAERVNHYITDGEVMLARLVVYGDDPKSGTAVAMSQAGVGVVVPLSISTGAGP